MSKVIRNINTQRPVWTSQPQGAVDIDWGNPITRGLKLCLRPYAGMRDLASPSIPWVAMPGANPSKTVSKAGTGLHTLSTIVCYPHFRVDTPSQTHLLMMDWEGSDEQVSGVLAVGTTINTISLAANKAYAGVNLTLLAGIQSADSTKLLTTLKEGAFLIKASVAGAATYDRGALVESIPLLAPITNIGGASKVTISGDIYTDGTYVSYSTVYVYMFWDRELSDAEAKSVTANPWQIFQPLARQVPFDLVRGPTEPRPSYMMGTTAPKVSTGMPAAILKTGWTSQPPKETPVDRSHPLLKNCIFFYAAGNAKESIGGKPRTKGSAYAEVGNSRGLGLTTLANGGVSFPAIPDTICNETTFFAYVYVPALKNTMGGEPFVRTGQMTTLSVTGYTGGMQVAFRQYMYPIYVGTHSTYAGSLLKVGQFYLLVGTFRRNSYIRIYANGSLVSESATTDYAVSLNPTADLVQIGSGEDRSMSVLFSGISTREFSKAEVQQFASNPNQIFAPQSKQIWVTT